MEDKLIDFFRKNDIFYNRNNKQYKNKYLRDKKLEELSEQLNVPVKKLKFRWRSLRDKFFREWKANNNPSQSHDRTPKKKWKWMDKMAFLNDVAARDSKRMSSDEGFDSITYSNLADEFSSTASTFEIVNLGTDVHSGDEEPIFDVPARRGQQKIEKEDTAETVTDKVDEQPVSQAAAPTGRLKNEKEDTIEKLMVESRNEMRNLISLAKEALVEPVEKQKTVVETFFEMLAVQTTEANLTPREFSMLQVELLKCFHKFLYKC